MTRRLILAVIVATVALPTPGAVKPIQRVPSGFPGPGGIGFSPFAQSESGGRHQGSRCMSTMLN